jgi:hypothetical protein
MSLNLTVVLENQTQLPANKTSLNLKTLFDSEDDVIIQNQALSCIENSSETDFASNVDDFMASQNAIQNNLLVNIKKDENDAFVLSDEDLSDLDCFISIPKLIEKGGDFRRRAEFIRNQFQKISTDTSNLGQYAASAQNKRPRMNNGKGLGTRRSRYNK